MEKTFVSIGVRSGGRTFIEIGAPNFVGRLRIHGAIEGMAARGEIPVACFVMVDSRPEVHNILILAMPEEEDALAKVQKFLKALARELRLWIEQVPGMSGEAYEYYTRMARRLRASEN